MRKATDTDESIAFDPALAVARYRDVIVNRDAESTRSGKAKNEKTAAQMRRSWKEWQGEDSLHEMAFGEPEE